MKTDELPGRLDAVVSLVPENALTVADIGYDHGYALVLLAERFPEAQLCGVEKIPDAARRFYSSVSTPELERIELFNGDGFEPIVDRDLDAAILAGMGEATVLTIASNHPALSRRIRSLIVCTPQMPAIVRPAFAALGYGVREEHIAYDGRRFYEAIAFDREVSPADDPIELLFGPSLLTLPAAPTYLRARKSQWSQLIAHHGSAVIPKESWPEADALNSGEYQRIKARALDEALRRVQN
ncbi:MAG: tRNA (adenine(22)-N(1))-methyltransferase TrmK [Myxococcota bacterium]